MANSRANREKKRQSEANYSYIGFDKRRFNSVAFNGKEHKHGIEGSFVKFRYGVKDTRPMIGKVLKASKRGVETITDFGFYNAIWKRVERVYIPK